MAGEQVLVTGAAGFIGMHVSQRLLAEGYRVLGLDNLNTYYDPRLKEARLRNLASSANFQFQKMDVADRKGVADLFAAHRFDYVVHLAAQAGVRHSLVDPHTYADANLIGFLNVLEGCRHHGCRHLVYASSSSVYGGNTRVPFSTSDNVDHPLSLYGATKKANELMAHAYAHLFRLPATGLRFFTVYGPWGRPDMAMWLFADAIMAGRPIRLFNHGQMRRDFTYVDDVVEAVTRLVPKPAAPEPGLVGEGPRSGHQQRPLARLQHRQQQPGRGARRGPPDRGGARPQGAARDAADATRGCAGDLRGRRRPRAGGRISAENPDFGRGSPVPGMAHRNTGPA